MAACIITLKVSPNAKKTRWARTDSGEIKCYVTSPAIDGKANYAVIEALSKGVGVSKSSIKILTGHTCKIKRVELAGDVTIEFVLESLGLNFIQEKMF